MTLEKPAGTASKLGTYELLKEQPGIGVGATWIARSSGDGSESPKLFTVLRVHKHLTKKPDTVEAFAAETEGVTRFRHPNATALVEVGNESGELYVVSEHQDGETLAGLITAAGAQGLPQPVVLRIVADVLGALTAAHAHDPPFGHGELGPHQVLVGDDGVARLGGLVVSRAFSKVTPPIGAKNHDRLSYAAPERVKTLASPAGAPVTSQSDVFSMGVILWEAIAHQRLFTSKIEAAIVQKVLTAPIASLASLPGISVDAPLAEAVRKAIERDPAKRTQSPALLLAEIEALGPGAIATPGEVAGVVERLAGKTLATRKADVRAEITRRRSNTKGTTIPPPAAPKIAAVPRKATLLGISVVKPGIPATDKGAGEAPPSSKPAEVKPVAAATTPKPAIATPRPAVAMPKPAVATIAAPEAPPARATAESMNLDELEVVAKPPGPPPREAPKAPAPHRATLLMGAVSEEKQAPASQSAASAQSIVAAQALLEASGKTHTPSTDGPSSRSKSGIAVEKVGPGSTLGRYEILMPVARGGMASVWAARLPGSRGFQKIFAIKTMLPDVSDDPDFEQMFLDEGKVAARIRHPNVVEIIDLGEQDDVLYLVMEWVEGDNLGSLVKGARAQGGIPMPIILRIASQVCAGLHAAHELRDDDGSLLDLIHRDISPANVLVSTSGFIKIVDFGIAKSKARLHVTRIGGMVKGKTPYLSPEQLGQQPTDRRSDIFSLGALLYVLATGLHPFRGETDSKTIENIALREPVPLSAIAPATPVEFESLVLKALSKDPKERFATAADMQRAVDHVAAALGYTTTEEDVAAFVRKALGETLSKRAQDLRGSIERADTSAAKPAPEAPPSIDAIHAAHAHSELSRTAPQSFLATPPPAEPVAMGETPRPPARPVAAPGTETPKPASAAAALPPPPPADPVEAQPPVEEEEVSFEAPRAAPASITLPPRSPEPEMPQARVVLGVDLPKPKQPEAATLPEILPPPMAALPAPEMLPRDEATSRPVIRSDSDETTREVQGIPPKRKPVAFIAVGAALGVCALVGLVAVVSGGKKDASDTPPVVAGAGPVGQAVTAIATQAAAPAQTVAPQAPAPAETATPAPAAAEPGAPASAPIVGHPAGKGFGKTTPVIRTTPPAGGGTKPKPIKKPYNPGTL